MKRTGGPDIQPVWIPMDPPGNQHGTLQRQDATVTDPPLPLTEDLQNMQLYECLEVFPENDDAHVYESTLSGLIPPAEQLPKPTGPVGASGGEGAQKKISGHRPDILRHRLPSACLPGVQRGPPPPLPPRNRGSVCNTRNNFFYDQTEPNPKINRSRTFVDDVSRLNES